MLEKIKIWREERQVKKRLRAAHKCLEADGPYFAQEIARSVAMGFNPGIEQYTWLKLVRRAGLGFARQGHALDFYETVQNAQFGRRSLNYLLLLLRRLGLEGTALGVEEAKVYADGVDACDEELWRGEPREWGGAQIRTDLKEVFDRAKSERKKRIEEVYHA